VTAGSFEHFVELARTAVEAEAGLHADDRWWVLEPTILVQRARGGIEPVELSDALARRRAGRALLAGDLAAVAHALDVKRCAVAVHVDLELDGEIAPRHRPRRRGRTGHRLPLRPRPCAPGGRSGRR